MGMVERIEEAVTPEVTPMPVKQEITEAETKKEE